MMSKAGTVDSGSRGEENAAADPYRSGCQAAYFIAPYPPIDSPASSWLPGVQSTEKFALRKAGISSVWKRGQSWTSLPTASREYVPAPPSGMTTRYGESRVSSSADPKSVHDRKSSPPP
jgi:hypothetical protein